MYHRNCGENIKKEKVVDNEDGQVNKVREILQDSCGIL